jgi:2-aminoadipate transaminase
VDKKNDFAHLVSRRGNLEHPWSTVTPPPEGLISFGGGIPDPATLPLEELSDSAKKTFSNRGVDSLQYGGSSGDIRLRSLIAERITGMQKVQLSPENVVLTNGASQALDIICAAFIDEGDVVVSETPTFIGSLWTMRSYGAKILPVTIETAGLDTSNLEGTLEDLKAQELIPKFIYLTPDFQNPTGIRMDLDTRKKIVSLARQYGTFIVEDTAYAELVLDGPSLPSLFSLDPDSVVQMSTFSKIIGPGLRLGWLTGAPPIVQSSTWSRTDMGSSVTTSNIVAQFIEDGYLDPHINKMKTVYRDKRDTLDRVLSEMLHGIASWNSPEGGFFFWVTANDNIDVHTLLEEARNSGVGFAAGFRFNVEPDTPSQGVRLAFSEVSLDNIPEGISRLSKAMQKLL